jgi:hypothetical protein
MSGGEKPDVWTVDGLRNAPEWVNCRMRALDVLLTVN